MTTSAPPRENPSELTATAGRGRRELAIRESDGAAIAVSDADMVAAMRDMGAKEGISAAPEGGAAFHALKVLLTAGRVMPSDTVVVFNTGGALKYLDVLA